MARSQKDSPASVPEAMTHASGPFDHANHGVSIAASRAECSSGIDPKPSSSTATAKPAPSDASRAPRRSDRRASHAAAASPVVVQCRGCPLGGARSKATVTWQVDAPTPVSTCTRDAEHATVITKVRGVPTAPDGTAVTWASPTVARPVRSLSSEVRMTVQPGPCHVWGSIPGVTATSRHEGG